MQVGYGVLPDSVVVEICGEETRGRRSHLSGATTVAVRGVFVFFVPLTFVQKMALISPLPFACSPRQAVHKAYRAIHNARSAGHLGYMPSRASVLRSLGCLEMVLPKG